MDLYKLIRDLIDEAKKQKNLEFVDKLIEIKLALSEIQEENSKLKKLLEERNNIERHQEGNYVTLKDDPLNIQYCSTCWGKEYKLIQLRDYDENRKGYPRCPVCFENWLKSRS